MTSPSSKGSTVIRTICDLARIINPPLTLSILAGGVATVGLESEPGPRRDRTAASVVKDLRAAGFVVAAGWDRSHQDITISAGVPGGFAPAFAKLATRYAVTTTTSGLAGMPRPGVRAAA